MTIHEAKTWAKEIDPRLSLADYNEHHLEVRCVERNGSWKQINVIRNRDSLHPYLLGLQAGVALAKTRKMK
jgi:hypothetical protein